MNWTRSALALLVLTLALTLVGTGIAQGQATRNPDTLVLVRFGDPETLDPAYSYDTASSEIILWHVYETLIFFNGGSTGQFVPMLATQVPSVRNGGISMDGKIPIFYLIGLLSREKDKDPKDSRHSMVRFAEPLLDVFSIPHARMEGPDDVHLIAEYYRKSRERKGPAAVLVGLETA